LKWRLILNEQMKNNDYNASYETVMNLAQSMLAGRSLEAFLYERRAQEAKHKKSKAKDQAMYTPQQIYDFAIFDVNTSGKAGAQIPHLPLGDDSSPWGRYCSKYVSLHGLHGCV
jgi:hypothetical protein